MLIGAAAFFFAISLARSRRWKLSSEYQQRTSSASSFRSGAALPGRKNPRAWLLQLSRGLCVRWNQARESGSAALMQPAQGGLTIRARLKLLLTTAGPTRPFFFAYSRASSIRFNVQ